MLGYVYIKYSDIVGRRAHLNTVTKSLRPLKLSSTLFTLTRINALLGRHKVLDEGISAMRDLQSLLITTYIDNRSRADIENVIRTLRKAENPRRTLQFLRANKY